MMAAMSGPLPVGLDPAQPLVGPRARGAAPVATHHVTPHQRAAFGHALELLELAHARDVYRARQEVNLVGAAHRARARATCARVPQGLLIDRDETLDELDDACAAGGVRGGLSGRRAIERGHGLVDPCAVVRRRVGQHQRLGELGRQRATWRLVVEVGAGVSVASAAVTTQRRRVRPGGPRLARLRRMVAMTRRIPADHDDVDGSGAARHPRRRSRGAWWLRGRRSRAVTPAS